MSGCVVLACADERDLPASIAWLTSTGAADVVAVAVDLGQGWSREALQQRALAAGAVRLHVVDARDEFARDHVLPALRAEVELGAAPFAGPDGPLAAFARPILARAIVEVAALERATAVAVEPELEPEVAARNPAIARIVLPGQDPSKGAAARAGVPGRSQSAVASRAPVIAIGFDRGVPVSVNGVPMPLMALVESLSTISGTVGATVLRTACRALETERSSGTIEMHLINGACVVGSADAATPIAAQPS